MNYVYFGITIWLTILTLFVLFRIIISKNNISAPNLFNNLEVLDDKNFNKLGNLMCPICNHDHQKDGYIVLGENSEGIILNCKNSECNSKFLYNETNYEAYKIHEDLKIGFILIIKYKLHF